LEKIIEHLVSSDLKKKLLSIEKLVSGGNNQVFKIICDDEKLLAKVYFPKGNNDKNRRLSREFNALHFLWQHGIRQIPEPIHADRENQIGIYEYIDGRKINKGDIQHDDLSQAARFLGKLHGLSESSDVRQIGIASDACLTLQDYWGSIETRHQKICQAIVSKKKYRHVADFMETSFYPVCKIIRNRFEEISAETTICHLSPVLSPSDFGFHNALKLKSGEITFIDFEYFGWDDPAKMISDFFHHPAMGLSVKEKLFFLNSFITFSEIGNALIHRLKKVYFAVGLKWCLLMLNICLPDVMDRKRFANPDLQDAILIEEQLEKSKVKLIQLQEEFEHSSFFLNRTWGGVPL